MKNIVKIAMSVILAFGCAYIAKSQACLGSDNTISDTVTSSALGADNIVYGKASAAIGQLNIVSDSTSTNPAYAIGYNNSATAKLSFAFGEKNNITKNNSFAFGRGNVVSNANSLAIGNNNTINSTSSITIGYKLKNTQDWGITIGYGYNTTDKLLVNNTNGIMMGMNSDKPTFFISEASGTGKTGKVGIGNVTELQAKLHIKADSGENADILLDGANSSLYFRNKDNCISVATNSMDFTSQKYVFKNAGITMYRNTSTNISEIFINGTSNKISVSPDNTMSFAAGGFSFNNGKVGIGCDNDVEGFSLAVKDGIITEKVVIKTETEWPDFVFSKDYDRMNLHELEEYIERNHHLPEVPSAEDVSANGINLGEMDAILLQNIEELTLHVMELQKQIDAQQDKIDIQQDKIEGQQKEIDELKAK